MRRFWGPIFSRIVFLASCVLCVALSSMLLAENFKRFLSDEPVDWSLIGVSAFFALGAVSVILLLLPRTLDVYVTERKISNRCFGLKLREVEWTGIKSVYKTVNRYPRAGGGFYQEIVIKGSTSEVRFLDTIYRYKDLCNIINSRLADSGIAVLVRDYDIRKADPKEEAKRKFLAKRNPRESYERQL